MSYSSRSFKEDRGKNLEIGLGMRRVQYLGLLDKRESFKQGVLSGSLKLESVGEVESAYIIHLY